MTHLTPVQERALQLARGKPGFGWFLDMGLGKTLVALTEFMHHAHGDKEVTRMVVICPNSFKSGWVNEIEKHGFRAETHVVESRRIKAAEAFVDRRTYKAPPILIVNYEAARLNKVVDLIEAFAYKRGTMLVIDESIALKNPRAQQSKMIRSIRSMFRKIRILTGKPTTQGPHDLWAQLFVIGAQDCNYYAFRARYCKLGGWNNKKVVGAQNTVRLNGEMRPFTFLAKKGDWLAGLPEKTFTIRRYELGQILSRHYKEMEKMFVTWLKQNKEGLLDKKVSVEIALTKYLKLSQIQCGFIHDESGQAQPLVQDHLNPRLNLLIEVMRETSGKVAIVYRHHYSGQQLMRVLQREGYAPVQLRGGLRPDEIDKVKDTFNDDPKCRAILLQQEAARYGHTLLGDQSNSDHACSTMIFFENSFSLNDRAQVEDRIHRLGQAGNCLYVDLVGTEMDELVIAALQHKEGLYRAVMSFAEKPQQND